MIARKNHFQPVEMEGYVNKRMVRSPVVREQEQNERTISTTPVVEKEEMEEHSLEVTTKGRPWNDPKYVRQKKEYSDNEAYQQVFLLALLNRYADIVVEKPNKQTRVSVTTPKISSLTFEHDDTINVAVFADKQCRELCRREIEQGVSQSTAVRRLEKNRKVFLENLLIDLVEEMGIDVTSTYSRRSNKTFQMERINSIALENERVIDKEDIIALGKQVNAYVLGLFSKNKTVTLSRNDPSIQNILLQ